MKGVTDNDGVACNRRHLFVQKTGSENGLDQFFFAHSRIQNERLGIHILYVRHTLLQKQSWTNWVHKTVASHANAIIY